jgi:hypothetical protein
LILDFKKGNLLRVCPGERKIEGKSRIFWQLTFILDGKIQIASHGTKKLNREEIEKNYESELICIHHLPMSTSITESARVFNN